jgi:uncharacterized LabA/DUF88 family protein
MMNDKVRQVLEKTKGKKIGVFIDDANIFHSQKEIGWKINWASFRSFLSKYYEIAFVNFYRGKYPINFKISQKIKNNHQKFVQILQKNKFQVIERDLKKIYIDKSQKKFIFKCDFDGEIGYDVASLGSKYDIAVIVSGDSDFTFLKDKPIKILFFCFDYKAPWEIRRLPHIFFEEIETSIKKHPPKRVNITKKLYNKL